jgi:hypothetical protein
MISLFSKLMDRAVEPHFRKDPSGRLVFIPFSLSGKCYFIDSKSDEEKTRAFVKMYRSAFTLTSLIGNPVITGVALFFDDFAGLTPRSHRLAIALGIPLFFWLVLGGLMLMLWLLYKQAVPSFTATLSDAGPDVKLQLTALAPGRRRVILAFCGALVLLLGVALLLVTIQHRPRRPCPAQPHVCQQVEVDSTNQTRPQS